MSWWLNKIDDDQLVSMTNRADILAWQSRLSHNKDLGHIFGTKLSKHHGMDIFNVLWRLHPQLKPPNLTDDKAFSAWTKRLMKSEEYQKLHDKTLQSRDIAAAATVKIYKKFKGDEQSALNTLEKLQQNIKDAQDIGSQELVDTLSEALDAMAEAIENTPMSKQEAAAVEKVNDEVDTVMEFVQMVSGGKGQGIGGDPFTVVADMLGMEQVIKQLKHKDFKRILELAGRMTAVMENKRKTGIHRSAVPMDITQGNTLEKVLPSEFALLVDEDMEDLFYHKFATKTLVQFQVHDKQAEGKGPIIFCCDHSGSMYGEPMNMAMGVMTAMAREAVREGRPLAYIPFASYAVKEPVMITDPITLANAISNGYKVGSGTEFSHPYNLSIETIKNSNVMQKADIIFISDGQAYLKDSWIRKFIEDKTALNFKNLGISIQTQFSQDQLPMFDGIMHMGRGKDLRWFEDFANYYERER